MRQVGKDPINERNQLKAAEAQAIASAKADKARERLTLARAARDYHERAIESKLTPKHAAQWISSLENHIPRDLWNAPVASITAPQLLGALSKIGHHERARNITRKMPLETISRIRQRLSAVFEDCMFHGHCNTNPAVAVRRKLIEVMAQKRTMGLRSLPFREAPAVLQQLRAMPGTAARCLEFAMLTASRSGEALGARWSEIDLTTRTWTIPGPRMKAKEPHTVYLSASAVSILEGQVGQDETIVFPTPRAGHEGRAMSDMSMLTQLRRAGLRNRTTVHGLCRKTFSTWANETGAARADVIEAALAHAESNRVRAAYNLATYNDERRALMDSWAEFLNSSAEVLQFSSRAA